MTQNIVSGIGETISPTPVKIIVEESKNLSSLFNRLKTANSALAVATKEIKLVKEQLKKDLNGIHGFYFESSPVGSVIQIQNTGVIKISERNSLDQGALRENESAIFERYYGPMRVINFDTF